MYMHHKSIIRAIYVLFIFQWGVIWATPFLTVNHWQCLTLICFIKMSRNLFSFFFQPNLTNINLWAFIDNGTPLLFMIRRTCFWWLHQAPPTSDLTYMSLRSLRRDFKSTCNIGLHEYPKIENIIFERGRKDFLHRGEKIFCIGAKIEGMKIENVIYI